MCVIINVSSHFMCTLKINIGILENHPGTTEGVINIMPHLQKLAPTTRITPTHGDQLSHERMTDAKRARNVNTTKVERLQLLEQVTGEFHHRGILLHVYVCLSYFNFKTSYVFTHRYEHNSWLVCWSLTSLCHSNGHIETMPARAINPFTALTRIPSQFIRTQ